MSNIRIKDIETTATAASSDDYVAIDGTTNGTRKILASDVIGDTTYSISISNGVITLTGSDSSTSTVTLPIYSGGVS